MKIGNIYMTLFLALSLLSACHNDGEPFAETSQEVSLVLMSVPSLKAAGDPDDLPAEYAVKDLSVFLATPGSNTVLNSFIHTGFSPSGDNCTLVNLPLDPATAAFRDIYVVANCSDVTSLNAVTTVSDIKALATPQGPLTTAIILNSGLPMYGQAANVNLGGTSAASPANITLTRACAKLRVTMENVTDTSNAFIVENAAPSTLYAPGTPLRFGTLDLITYPQITLDSISPGMYQSIIYIYESLQSPCLRILTSIKGISREYVANSNFPLPVRGYLYDIRIQILPAGLSGAMELHTRNIDGSHRILTYKITDYGENLPDKKDLSSKRVPDQDYQKEKLKNGIKRWNYLKKDKNGRVQTTGQRSKPRAYYPPVRLSPAR
ncbi:fimbrial protein [Dysgonomonas sp. HGC4]|uniref:fimbrial protein n=1 Tax=Dysgonomonas sp. HGC4 TaxID=1658009 RepID=UPI00068214A2|nr:fimbrial protein [Dysgonomonas sp. HGC4]MBD8349944.1 DUF4906 domain-containing protein [Dysgonomonas sp. HGC4]